MNIHFIAIGGAVMHNLALALQAEGHRITGSDDAINEPSRSRLAAENLLPAELGWFPDRIHAGLDAVILGMHARQDNPELARAQELGLRVYSFPEFVFEHSRHKQRIVIAGSHGKTTITSMVLHVLRGLGLDFDYLVGAKLDGFPYMVRLSQKAPMIVIEGDEYAASPMDLRPKFLLYQPHIISLSGIAWDHVNVFPTEELYVDSFRQLLQVLPKAGTVVFNAEDERVVSLVSQLTDDELHYRIPYSTPAYRVKPQTRGGRIKAKLGLPRKKTGDGPLEVTIESHKGEVQVYGRHNLSNLMCAHQICRQLGIETQAFLAQIASFHGANLRLETVHEDDHLVVIRDFAHSPSKVKATVAAVAERYRKDQIVAVLELHTFSSLDRRFLSQYKDTLDVKGLAAKIVLVSAAAVAHKKLQPIGAQDILTAFNDRKIQFVDNGSSLHERILANKSAPDGRRTVLLLMSSGNLDGLELAQVTGNR